LVRFEILKISLQLIQAHFLPIFLCQEDSLVKGGMIDPPWARNNAKAKPSESKLRVNAGRWQSLANVDSNEPPSAAKLGKLAVEAAAAHPGGSQHLDDYYVPVNAGGQQAPSSQQKSDVDKKVPAGAVESAVYPLIGGYYEEPPGYDSTAEAFKHELRAAGLSDKVNSWFLESVLFEPKT
jgi:hypothetical protein